MTENELRTKVADAARSWLGLKEVDGSFKPIIDLYNQIKPLPVGYRMSYTDPWCAAFVSAVGAKCGMTDIILPECGCDRMIALYKSKGRWQEDDAYNAQVGDLVMYDWQDSGVGDNTGSADHVGLILSVSGTAYTVIEGNTSDKVGLRTIAKNGRFIRGFCCPDYASKADKPEATQSGVKDEQEFVISLRLPILARGDKGESVKAMQMMLIGRGCSCGTMGADGDFGYNTNVGLLNFQRRNGLETDALCGAETWKKLLGV